MLLSNDAKTSREIYVARIHRLTYSRRIPSGTGFHVFHVMIYNTILPCQTVPDWPVVAAHKFELRWLAHREIVITMHAAPRSGAQ